MNFANEWRVAFHPRFVEEQARFSKDVKKELARQLNVIKSMGPQAGRPRVDTLKASRHANMKELRLDADGGVWRFAFAFDPTRQAIILYGGDKSGMSQSRFYKDLIERADNRYDEHLKQLQSSLQKDQPYVKKR